MTMMACGESVATEATASAIFELSTPKRGLGHEAYLVRLDRFLDRSEAPRPEGVVEVDRRNARDAHRGPLLDLRIQIGRIAGLDVEDVAATGLAQAIGTRERRGEGHATLL